MKTKKHIHWLAALLLSLSSSFVKSAEPTVEELQAKFAAAEAARAKALADAEANAKLMDDYAAALAKHHVIAQRQERAVEGEPVAVRQSATGKFVGAQFYDFLGPDGLGSTIRRSLLNKKDSALPALFQYSRPGSGDDSWSADIGWLLEPKWLRSIDEPKEGDDFSGFSLNGEYHYNAASASLKDTVGVGAGWFYKWNNDTLHEAVLSVDAGWRRDQLVAGEGWAASVKFEPRLGYWKLFDTAGNPFLGLVTWKLRPFIGVEAEGGNGASDDFGSGERVSAVAGFEVTAFLFPDSLGNRFAWTNSLSYWGHLSTSGGYESYDDNQLYWVSSLTYWLNTDTNNDGQLDEKEQHFGVTVSYTNGDNPNDGEFDADLLTVGFAVKF